MSPSETSVVGREIVMVTEEKRKRKFLWMFNLEWWEITKRENIGNEIHIRTSKPITEIYLNGQSLINANVEKEPNSTT